MNEEYREAWELMEIKYVPDADGFNTEYSLWYDTMNDKWCCIFGDTEYYDPYDSDHDADFDQEWEAREWFEDYTGFADDADWRDDWLD